MWYIGVSNRQVVRLVNPNYIATPTYSVGFFCAWNIFIHKVEIINQIIQDRILQGLFLVFFISLLLLCWIEKPRKKPKKSSKSSEKPIIWYRIKK